MRVESNRSIRREERSLPPSGSQPVQLNFKNHCLFCLEPQPPSTIQEIRDNNPKQLRSLQPVLHYLTGTDPTYDESTEECGWMGVPAVGNLPPMCPSCYNAMAELYQLHEELLNIQVLIQEQTQLARQTVPLRSQSSSRQQFFSRIQSSGLSVEEVAAVQKFVDNLHNKIIKEDKKQVIFPARVPPDFFPNPERHSDLPIDCAASSETNPPSKHQNVSSPCSLLENPEVVMLPPIVETDDIKYENEYGDEEMSEPDMFIPDEDANASSSEQSSSDFSRGTPSPIAVRRTRVSQRIKFKKETSFERSRSPTSAVRRRRKESVTNQKFKKDSKGKIIRRQRNVRRVINGVSTYVAQYCDLCNKLLPTAEILKHLEDGHNLRGYIVECPSPKCPYFFSCRGKMEKHLGNQNPRKCQIAANIPASSFFRKCETCGFTTRSMKGFRNHLQRHESEMPEKTISCPIPGCSERCALRQSVEDHINFHQLRPPKKDQECSVCNERLKIKNLTEHLIEIHSIKEPVPCKRCPLIFHNWESLLDHLSEHYSPSGLSCDICSNGIMIDKLESLREHYFSVHGIGKEFICENCDNLFYIQTVLSSHKKRCHAKEQTSTEPGISTKGLLHKGNIKCETENGNEEEMQEPDLTIPNLEETSGQASNSGNNAPARINCKSKNNFEPTRSLSSILRQRKSASIGVRKTRAFGLRRSGKNVGGVLDRIPRQRIRNVRRVINGVSTYVAQYCDLCNEFLPSTEMLKHLEDIHNLKGYIVECPSPKCPYLFSCRGKMEKHLGNQNPRKCQTAANIPVGSFCRKCETCDYETRSGKGFRNHLKRHESEMPEKTISCPIPGCGERYALRQSMENHISFHEPPKTDQECSVCKERLKIKDLTEHLVQIHKIDEPVPCKRCPFIFHNWEYLVDHLADHYSPGGLSCDICDDGIRIDKLESLRQHYFVAHEIGKQILCEHCNKAFFTQTMLSAHNKRNHSDKKKKSIGLPNRLKCELCPEPVFFSAKTSLRTHKIKFHEGDPFPCKFCDKTFITMHSLYRHQSQHTGSARKYKCSVEGCGRTFQNRTLLRYHEVGKHSGTQNFVCDTCGKKFNFPTVLRAHVVRTHLGIVPRKCVCETCGRTLASKKSLRTHMLVHSGERPHVCHICHQTFRHREAMLTHVRAHEEKGESFRPKGPRSK